MKRVWLEKTYRNGHDHREEGSRAVGKAIWSPIKSSGGQDIYKNMRDVSVGDVIIHLVDNKLIVGTSLVVDKEIQIVNGLPNTKWDDPENYLWNLNHYKEFKHPIIVKDFLKDPNNTRALDQIRESSEVFYDRLNTLRQGAYLTPVSKELLTLLNNEFSENHYEPRMPNITQNLIYSPEKDIEVILEKNFDEISLLNKGENYKSSHDESLEEIISQFKKFNFRYLSEKSIKLKPAGDIDFVILAEDTLIIGEYKKGRNLEKEVIFFNGKKNKYLKYLNEEFSETKGRFKNVLFLVIGELIDERKLSQLENKLINKGIIDDGPTKFKDLNILGTRVIHRTQVNHYFDLADDIHPDYALKDFYKDFNILPVKKTAMTVPAIRSRISHDDSDSYDVFNFSCKATDLIKFASVSRRTPVKEEISSYQRLIDSKRIKSIGEEFLTEKQGFFPNNIVLKLEKSKISFKKSDLSDNEEYKGFESDLGLLKITEDYNTAWVIDGQHRLFSYFKIDENDKKVNNLVNVAAIVGVPAKKEVEYFIDINDKGKSVDKDLIWDLTGKIDPLSSNGIISNACKELYSSNKVFKDRQLNPFYRKLTIPSLTDKRGRNFALLCSLLKFECIGQDITKPTYTKKMGEKEIKDVKNPFYDDNGKKFSQNISKSFSSFFEELMKLTEPSTTKKLFNGNNPVFVLTLIADRYFRYHNRITIKKDDNFFKVLSKFLNSLDKERLEFYKQASNAQRRREVIGDIVYHMQNNYKEDFFNVVQQQLIIDIHNFCESKFPEFVHKKVENDFGVDFVFKCSALKSHASNHLENQNFRGNKDAESWEGLNFYSDIIKNFLLNNNSLKLGKNDNIDKFEFMLNDNGTINVWDHCFREVFITVNKTQGFKDKDAFLEAIKSTKRYFDATRHTKKHYQRKKDNFDPLNRAIIKAQFNLLDKIVDKELAKL